MAIATHKMRINLAVDREIGRAIKVAAAEDGYRYPAHWVEDAVREKLDRRAPEVRRRSASPGDSPG